MRRRYGFLLATGLLLAACDREPGAGRDLAAGAVVGRAVRRHAVARRVTGAGTSSAAPVPTATASPVKTFTDKPPQAQYREFHANCTETHRLSDDPIVFPGLAGAAHNHTFVGNPAANATSTPQTLLGGAGPPARTRSTRRPTGSRP